MEGPGFFDSGLQLICSFGLLILIFLLTIPHRLSISFRSGEFAGQSRATYTLQVSGVTTAFICGSESHKLSFHVCTEQHSLPHL